MEYGDVATDPVLNIAHHLGGVETPHGAAVGDYVLSPPTAEDAPAYGVGLKGAVTACADGVTKSLVEGVLDGIRFTHLCVIAGIAMYH